MKNSNYDSKYSVLEIISSFENSFIDKGIFDLKEIIKFYYRRRIFSKYTLEKDLNKMSDIELQILFEQIKKNYLNKIYSGIISDSDSTDLSSILFEFLIRKLQLKDQLNLKNVELSKFIEKNVCFY